ncbi:RND family efflux transporter MFP subunit [Paenibacillus forsythiae]|uniref:RND family efflux transporter MFP subunit n=1 Tax=Paenibacillus forsythiae TaxID=365616 RepID=A0ABU3H3Z9_9BACL|nr:efflux RND transporter periplasmic adaptor subunit [Paenibacillus forsythiae]MDT3424757.1 RND family efflux transporter MFP subunit [Paenibacillus forsythiae]
MKDAVILNMKKRNNWVLTVVLVFCSLLEASCSSSPDRVTLSGIVEGEDYTVRSEVAGRVTEQLKNEGDYVKKGDILFVTDSALQQLVVKEQEAVVRGTVAKLNEAKDNENTSDSVITQLTAEADAAKAQLEQAKLVLNKHKITSPVNGIYTNRLVQVGDLINSGTAVAAVTDPENMNVTFYIPQKYVNRIQLNQKLSLNPKVISAKELSGTITFIAGKADFSSEFIQASDEDDNSAFKFEVQVDGKQKDLKSGMTVDTVIELK